jgi:hypothetical protein
VILAIGLTDNSNEDSNRRCVLRFDRKIASELRLALIKAREDMGVCELRVYDESAAR